jgi:hypothetical protein
MPIPEIFQGNSLAARIAYIIDKYGRAFLTMPGNLSSGLKKHANFAKHVSRADDDSTYREREVYVYNINDSHYKLSSLPFANKNLAELVEKGILWCKKTDGLVKTKQQIEKLQYEQLIISKCISILEDAIQNKNTETIALCDGTSVVATPEFLAVYKTKLSDVQAALIKAAEPIPLSVAAADKRIILTSLEEAFSVLKKNAKSFRDLYRALDLHFSGEKVLSLVEKVAKITVVEMPKTATTIAPVKVETIVTPIRVQDDIDAAFDACLFEPEPQAHNKIKQIFSDCDDWEMAFDMAFPDPAVVKSAPLVA